ncbi:uncharacterized protein [Diadema setosum]|uniref:uncharacterized protein n=1 Tax=Diadema setosum TaxID=31175 RepID=UPI003B3A7824
MEVDLKQMPQSTPKETGGQRSRTPRDQEKKSLSLSLDDTGESTRSLLSVLSHSSVQDLPEDILEDKSPDSSASSSKSCNSSQSASRSLSSSRSKSLSSSRSKSETESRSGSSTYSRVKIESQSSSSHTSSSKPPPLSPWEKWLVEKTKQERKKAKVKLKQEQEKLMKEKENKKMKEAQAKIIAAKVNVWIEEKTAKEIEAKKANMRLQRMQRKVEEEEKRRITDKAKASYSEWAEKKRAEEKRQKESHLEEEERKEEERRARKQEAEAAYQKWYDQAGKRAQPPAGSAWQAGGAQRGYDRASYPQPGYCNPIPWMPIHTPQEHSKPVPRSQRGRKKKSSSLSLVRQIQQPASPPLLFKERAARDGKSDWAWPR